MQMMAQFAEFKKAMQGKNPEAIVKQMLACLRSAGVAALVVKEGI